MTTITNNRINLGLEANQLPKTQKSGIARLTGFNAIIQKALGLAQDITLDGKVYTINVKSRNKWIARTTTNFANVDLGHQATGHFSKAHKIINQAIKDCGTAQEEILKNHVKSNKRTNFDNQTLTKKNVEDLFFSDQRFVKEDIRNRFQSLVRKNVILNRAVENFQNAAQEVRAPLLKSIKLAGTKIEQAEAKVDTAKLNVSTKATTQFSALPQARRELAQAQQELTVVKAAKTEQLTKLATLRSESEEKTLHPTLTLFAAKLAAARANAEHLSAKENLSTVQKTNYKGVGAARERFELATKMLELAYKTLKNAQDADNAREKILLAQMKLESLQVAKDNTVYSAAEVLAGKAKPKAAIVNARQELEAAIQELRDIQAARPVAMLMDRA